MSYGLRRDVLGGIGTMRNGSGSSECLGQQRGLDIRKRLRVLSSTTLLKPAWDHVNIYVRNITPSLEILFA